MEKMAKCKRNAQRTGRQIQLILELRKTMWYNGCMRSPLCGLRGLRPHAVLHTAHAIGVLAKMPLQANIFASLLNDYMRSPLCGLRGLRPTRCCSPRMPLASSQKCPCEQTFLLRCLMLQREVCSMTGKRCSIKIIRKIMPEITPLPHGGINKTTGSIYGTRNLPG